MRNTKVTYVTQASMIAAIYVVLNVAFAAFGTKVIQVRIAEAMTILPIFTPAAIPGIFIGCLAGNMIAGCILPDIIFGSLASLTGAWGTYLLRRKHPVLGTLPPIIVNTVTIPLILRYGYGFPFSLPYMMVMIGIGEVISCGILGMILYAVLKPVRTKIFKAVG